MPVVCSAMARARASPTTSQRARSARAGSASALRTTSGPMPAGSPMVRAMRGRSSCMEFVRYSNQIIGTAETAGFGDQRQAIEESTAENARGDAGVELTPQFDGLGLEGAA